MNTEISRTGETTQTHSKLLTSVRFNLIYIYYIWKNIRQNDTKKFELPDFCYSVSDILDYIQSALKT